jgi:hypothetical protein
MTARRLALGLLATAAALSTVSTSGATFSSSSVSSGSVGASADWTPPVVSVTAAVTAFSRGTVQVSATAGDATSVVASVRIEVRAAGSTGAWTTLCTATTAPYTCSWTTTSGPDGRYDLRAVATDSAGNAGTSAAVQRTVDNLGPVVAVDEAAMPDYLRGTVTVPAVASDAGSGVASVRIQRSLNGSTWTDLCTTTTSPYACSWSTAGLANGDWLLRAVATDVAGSSTTSATAIVTVDNGAPAVTTSSPGATLSATVTLTATASDVDSGIASVLVEQRASSTSPWVAVCTDTTSPYTCRWDTTQVTDGTTYAFRSTATDLAGNVAVSAVTVTSTVDNRLASVSVEDPGTYLSGTVALVANANAPGGVSSVALQYAPTGTTTWTTICVDSTLPYGCSWDTTRVPGGTYDLRAVLTPNTGAVVTSPLVTGRVVDNAPLRGFDVQASNGGVLGRVGAGDTLTLTYDDQVQLDSLVAGWTGGSRTVGLRLRDGSAAGGLGGEDVLDVFTTTGLTTAVPLGTVNTRGNYVKGQPMVFSATMTAETLTVNGVSATRIVLRFDALTSADNGRSFRSSRTMTWTPSAGARDLAGTAASTAPTDERGALDRDF